MVAWNKLDFMGADVLRQQRADGVRRALTGFELQEPGVARPGHEVQAGGAPVGTVTSGTRTPYLQKSIGMAYLPPQLSKPGTDLEVAIRDRRVRASVVSMPFYTKRAPSVGAGR